jgi:tRNA and rRNA cytosine-C5-methylases
LKPEDIQRNAVKQRQILEMASKAVMPTGSIHYSTCSLERDENENVVGSFLRDHPEFELVAPVIPEMFITGEGFGRTFPDRDEMDAFFVSVLKRL